MGGRTEAAFSRDRGTEWFSGDPAHWVLESREQWANAADLHEVYEWQYFWLLSLIRWIEKEGEREILDCVRFQPWLSVDMDLRRRVFGCACRDCCLFVLVLCMQLRLEFLHGRFLTCAYKWAIDSASSAVFWITACVSLITRYLAVSIELVVFLPWLWYNCEMQLWCWVGLNFIVICAFGSSTIVTVVSLPFNQWTEMVLKTKC